MAYIYLEELEEILPGILDQWIDKDDEGWAWIFQEIEQKCHVGKKEKKKKKVSKIDVIEIAIMAHRNDINELNKKFDEIKFDELKKIKEDIAFLNARMHVISGEAKEAKFAAQTAKQRTEVDYSKYSQTDKKYDQPITAANKCGSCKHLLKQPIEQPCIGCCHNGVNISGTDEWEAKENE